MDNPRTVKCPSCGQMFHASVSVCPHCDYPVALPTRGITPNQMLASFAPDPTASGRTAPGLTAQNLAAGGANLFEAHGCLFLRILPAGTSIMLVVDEPVVLGRGHLCDPANGLDLNDYDALRYGVSRHHCQLRQQDGRLHVSDLDSANGTYVNHRRLGAEESCPLQHGDLLVLGTLQFMVLFSAP